MTFVNRAMGILLGLLLALPWLGLAQELPWGVTALCVLSGFQLRLLDRRWDRRGGALDWISHVRMAPARLLPWGAAVIIALIIYTMTMEKMRQIAMLKLIGAPDRTSKKQLGHIFSSERFG